MSKRRTRQTPAEAPSEVPTKQEPAEAPSEAPTKQAPAELKPDYRKGVEIAPGVIRKDM